MSWDVTLFEVPEAYKSIEDLPSDFRPRKFLRSDLILKMQSIFPTADFSDPSWGHIDGEGWSIEVNIGNAETDGPMLHVRGGDDAVEAVMRICDVLGLRGFDCSMSEFLERGQDPGAGFRKWSAYRDQVVEEYARADRADGISAHVQQATLLQRLLRIFKR